MSAGQTRPFLPKAVRVCHRLPSALETGLYGSGVCVPASSLSGARWTQLGLAAVSVAGHMVATSLV